MANEPDIQCTSELYIEADSKLSALETFLRELDGDANARSVLLSMVRQLDEIVETGLEVVDARHLDKEPLFEAVTRLKEAVAGLPGRRVPEPEEWSRVRRRHRECRKRFSGLMDALLEGTRHQQPALYGGAPQFDVPA